MDVTQRRQLALEIIDRAIQSVDPYNLIEDQVKRNGSILQFPNSQKLELDNVKRTFVIGAGKGTAPMAKSMEKLLGDDLYEGAVVVKYDHTENLQRVIQYEAAHPVPDKQTLEGSACLLELISDLSEDDCVFVLLTGGGSALLELLPDSISLSDLQTVNRLLLESGATIHEINCVRKHISLIKGGQLARHIYPARCITFALSDVIGDDLSVIASGPTSPDGSTFADALNIINRFGLKSQIPESVIEHLNSGAQGSIPETPKAEDTVFSKVSNIVIGNNRLALKTAQEIAHKRKLNTLILTSVLEGEAKEIAKVLASVIREIQTHSTPVKKPACLLLGGEPTVHITGRGKGGRNQELCLAMALTGISKPYTFVSCGSDGTDGPTDSAGAIVSEHTLRQSRDSGLDAEAYLRNNDSYHFFDKLGDLIKTGPTGTNVMDIILVLIP